MGYLALSVRAAVPWHSPTSYPQSWDLPNRMSDAPASFVVMYESLHLLIAAVEQLRDDWAADGVAELSDAALVTVMPASGMSGD